MQGSLSDLGARGGGVVTDYHQTAVHSGKKAAGSGFSSAWLLWAWGCHTGWCSELVPGSVPNKSILTVPRELCGT